MATVNFGKWGSIALNPNQAATWWFTWTFDGNHWSRMSALPMPGSPPGGAIQIVDEWATPGTLWVTFKNNGNQTVTFTPTVIVCS